MQNYCEHLYDDSTDGYIQIFNIDENKKIKVYNTKINALCDVVEEVQEQLDFFITPNTFYKPYRQVNNIRQFRALFMDLDCGEEDKQFTAYSIFELAENGEIPRPTMIVDSGRGIHLYWRIKNAPYGALNTWQELQDFFYIKLKELGADRKATDAARVLRLPSSINSRNGEKCRVLWQDNEEEYSMYDLREQYLKFKHNKTISKAKKSNSKIINNLFFNSYSLHMARAEDLETLVQLRKGNMENCRNMALHCYAYWKGIYIRDNDELRSTVEAFNTSFKLPLKQAEVNAVLRCIPKAIDKFLEYEQGIRTGLKKRVTKGMRDKGGYWYKNETLIERLEITADEQRHLKTIIGTRVKYDRKNEKRNKARRNENGLTNKQQEIADLKKEILKLREEGLSLRVIAKQLNKSVGSIQNILKK